MGNNFKHLEQLYNNIYNVTLEVSALINQGNFEAGIEALNRREILFKECHKIRENIFLLKDEKDQLNELIDKIKSLDVENTQKIMGDKDFIQKEIARITKSQKVISAYKFNKDTIQSRLFDSKN